MSMDERMTICNMSIEGGARVGYVNPDETTFAYLRGPPVRAAGEAFDRARDLVAFDGLRSRTHSYDDEVHDRGGGHRADRHLGHQSRPVGRVSASRFPRRPSAGSSDGPSTKRSNSWAFAGGQADRGHAIDVAFIGSCTNGAAVRPARSGAHRARAPRRAARQGARRSRLAGGQARGRARRTAPGFHGGGIRVARRGLLDVPGMNPDRLEGRQICASSSNRNFKGRQGSPSGRTLLMSPAMVAAAAVAGEVVDVRADAQPAPASVG